MLKTKNIKKTLSFVFAFTLLSPTISYTVFPSSKCQAETWEEKVQRKAKRASERIHTFMKLIKTNPSEAFECIRHICRKVRKRLSKEPVLLELNGSFVIFGDFHGQFESAWQAFEIIVEAIKEGKIVIILGDFSQRAGQGIEVTILFFLLKRFFPKNFHIIAGNHELNSAPNWGGTIYDEIREKFGDDFENPFIDPFSYLSVAAILNRKIFAAHAAFPNDYNLKPLREAKKPLERPQPFSPPFSSIGQTISGYPIPPSQCKQDQLFGNRKESGFDFSEKALENFLKVNGLKALFRAHSHPKEGFDFPFVTSKCVTIGSFKRIPYGDYENVRERCYISIGPGGRLEIYNF